MDAKTCKKLIKIALLILVMSYAMDKLVFFSLNKISDKVMTGQSVGKLNQFLSLKDTTDFLVFGNSRANRHIDVDIFSDNGYNMGIDGIGIAYNSTIINTLSKEKKQLILVHIDTDNFFNTTYDGGDIRALKTKYQRDNNITVALNKSGQLSTLQHFFFSMNYNGTAIGIIKNYFKPNYDYRTYNGYDPLIVNESQEATRNIVLSKANTNKCLDSSKVNPLALEYLKSIKTFTEESSNKTFLFITTPMHNDICGDDNAKLAIIMQDIGLTYWDFTNIYKKVNDNSYWKDRTHMSKKGAETFSKHLLEKYKSFQN
jgi:hypothetical protein